MMDQVYISAISGDADAQAAMFDRVLAIGMRREHPDDQIMESAIYWARLAASHGRSKDILRLGGVLMLKAGMLYGAENAEEAAPIAAEVFARLDRLADDGDEEAARQLVRAAHAMADLVDTRPVLKMAAALELDAV